MRIWVNFLSEIHSAQIHLLIWNFNHVFLKKIALGEILLYKSGNLEKIDLE